MTDKQVTYQAPIDEDGIDMTIGPKHSAQETVIAYFAVDDLTVALNEAKAAGGKVAWGPEALPIAPAFRDDYKRLT